MTNDEALEERIEVIRDEIEAIEHNLDILEDEIDRERRHPDRPRTHVIVENHDNGETIRFWAPDKRTIGEVVAEVYAKFRLEQHPTDRLTRVSDGHERRRPGVPHGQAVPGDAAARAHHPVGPAHRRWRGEPGVSVPAPMDPVVAAAVFDDHLARTLASDQGRREGWTATRLDDLHAVVHLTATKADGTSDPYHLMLDARWYDEYPPQVRFVCPPPPDGDTTMLANWLEAAPGSPWLPNIDASTLGNSFSLHAVYDFTEDGTRRQLVLCTSMSFDYYISGHNPTAEQRWKQGRHTVAATLSRVQDVLHPPCYQGRSGALNT